MCELEQSHDADTGSTTLSVSLTADMQCSFGSEEISAYLLVCRNLTCQHLLAAVLDIDIILICCSALVEFSLDGAV